MNGWPRLDWNFVLQKSNRTLPGAVTFFASIKAIRRRTMMLMKPTINVVIIPKTSPIGTLIS